MGYTMSTLGEYELARWTYLDKRFTQLRDVMSQRLI